jgi:SOS-response transcriptional repressor LexA
MSKPFPIPVRQADETPEELETSACASGEPYALMVLGDSMAPEFIEGEIIVVEPEGLARDGSYVVAWVNEEYIFRQIVEHPEGWMLKPLNAVYPNIPVEGLGCVKGVVIMKKLPGKRKEQKSYA